MKTPTILQISETECGVACLAIIFSYYGVHIPLEMLREKCGSSRDGCKAETLISVAQEYGFEAKAFRVELEDLKKAKSPVIAFWRFNHYVVVEGVRRNKVYINDPAHGRLSELLSEADNAFTGVIIEICPTLQVIKTLKKFPFIKILLSWIKVFQFDFLFMSICMLAIMLGPFLGSSISSIVLDYCIIKKNIEWIPKLIIIILFITTILIWIMVKQKQCQFKLAVKSGLIQSSSVIDHILQLPLMYFVVRSKSELLAMISRIESVFYAFFNNISAGLVSGISLLIVSFVLIRIDYAMTIVLFLIMACTFPILLFIYKISFSQEKCNLQRFNQFFGYSMSRLKQIETIKCCGLEMKVLSKWYHFFMQKLSTSDELKNTNIIFNSTYKLFSLITLLSTLYIGGLHVKSNLISLGQYMAYYTLQLFFCNQLLSFFSFLKEFQGAYAVAERISDIFFNAKDKRFMVNQKIIWRVKPQAISFENVSFFYNRNHKATLKNISLTIQTGQHVALVGKSGSGKSTLLKMIGGIFNPTEGLSQCYGIDISHCSAEDLPKIFSYVGQETVLFSGTLYENLVLSAQTVSSDKLAQAIQCACLEDLVAKRGLYAEVSEHGNNFSGGEKQRIDVARAILQDTPIILFDEATSSLDVDTEVRLIQRLRELNKTILFVAHRLSTIQHCDQIIVMEEGAIVEKGVHDDLIQLKGKYYSLLQNEKANQCFQI
jgi:ATP-binding cassette subfamily C protein